MSKETSSSRPTPERGRFRDLFLREQALLGGAEEPQIEFSGAGPDGEPRVTQTPSDRVGLALSGGGIRSATFNLGVLKQLNDLKVLRHIEYLSTVSGGGYIGGWWTAWRKRQGEEEGKLFPAKRTQEPRQPGDPAIPEPEEVRHLREFSRFLIPRAGLGEAETWQAIITVLGGLVPALIAATAVLAGVIYFWLGWAQALLVLPRQGSMTVMLAFVVFYQWLLEQQWRVRKQPVLGPNERRAWWGWLFAVVLITLGCWWLALEWRTPVGLEPAGGWGAYLGLAGVRPAWAWLGAAGGVVLLRMLFVRCRRKKWWQGVMRSGNRVAMRMLALALSWLALAAIWYAGRDFAVLALIGSGFSSGLFAAYFFWLKKQIAQEQSRPSHGGLKDLLKPLVPQVLAYLAVGLAATMVAGLIQYFDAVSGWRWLGGVLAVLAVLFLALLLFDPEEMGLHAYYRQRIARAFLGASNPSARRTPRQTEWTEGDDLKLSSLEGLKPIHLICCTANDLGGDPLSGLGRGGRSAVLSRFGLSIGDDWAEQEVNMASALTASAAAFNSNMGSISMKLGPAVTFLMCALNLRLGYWAVHPLSQEQGPAWRLKRWFPGIGFFKEMAAWTRCGRSPASDSKSAPGEFVCRSDHVHLSDGGHFENMALYELIRRRCRLIIVSDCGADPEVAFDDFGNAVRRIRADFGVEIEIDLQPLCPGRDGFSRQHVAVGTIHFDHGTTGKDKGVLIYLKPTLTGDEPYDILQYRMRNRAFPHETTGDQFYDEAQWESYRKLGEHVTHTAFQFLEREENPQAAGIFTGARQIWYPTPEALERSFLELTRRCSEIEAQIRQSDSPLRFEFFAELEQVLPAPDRAEREQSNDRREAEITTLYLLLQTIQVLEDAWLACDLETRWNHPLNQGWMNYISRWACTPSCRTWWPVLKPIYGPGFRDFMDQRFHLKDGDTAGSRFDLREEQADFEQGLAWRIASRLGKAPSTGEVEPGKTARRRYAFNLSFPPPPGQSAAAAVIQLGWVVLKIKDEPGAGKVAEWSSSDFFVPPGYWGAGIGSRFLDRLIQEAWALPVQRCRVLLTPSDAPQADGKQPQASPGSRQEYVDMIEFYKSRQFRLARRPTASGEAEALELNP